MKKRFLIFSYCLFCSTIIHAQHLYSLLNWNDLEQKKNLIVWYDIQDSSTIEQYDNKVLRVKDKSIGGNNLSGSLSSPVRLLKENFNNRSLMSLSFKEGGYMYHYFKSKTNEHLNVTTNADEITSFAVGINKVGGNRLLYELGEGKGIMGEGVASWYSGQNSIESRVPNSNAEFAISNNNDDLMLLTTRGKSGDVESSLNEFEYKGKGIRNIEGSKYSRIGLSAQFSDGGRTDGKLYELILFNKKLTDEEYMKVKSYLIDKYNLKVAEKYIVEIKNGKVGVININGKVIIDFKYEEIKPLGAKYFAVKNNGYWGFYNISSEIIGTTFNDFKFSGNYLYLKKGEKWGVYSMEGKMIQDAQYSSISNLELPKNWKKEYFSERDTLKFAKVISAEKKVGLLDINFKEILPLKYDEIISIEYISPGYTVVYVKINNRFGCVDITDYGDEKGDNIYNIPANYLSVKDVNLQIKIKDKIWWDNVAKYERARKLKEATEYKIEAARVAKEAARIAKEQKLEAVRIANEKKLEAARTAQAQRKNLEYINSLQKLSNYYENLERASVAKRRQGRTVNAWQCKYCGVLSRSEEEPCCGKFGDCPSADSHSFAEANTNKGLQCTKCGKTSYILFIGRIPEEPCCGEFRDCTYGYHNWRHF